MHSRSKYAGMALMQWAKRFLPDGLATRYRDRRDRWRIASALDWAVANVDGDDAAAASFLEALRRAANGPADVGLERDFQAIERRRATLLASRQHYRMVDYGRNPKDAVAIEHELTVGAMTSSSKSRPWGELLYHLVRGLRPQQVVEMGTCVGISASYIALALRHNGGGRLHTLEGDPTLAQVSQETLRDLSLDTQAEVVVGPFHTTLVPTLAKAQPLGLVFHDGDHEGWCYVRDYKIITPHLADGGVIIYDDIRINDETLTGFHKIATLDSTRSAIDCGPIGAVVCKPAPQHTARSDTAPA